MAGKHTEKTHTLVLRHRERDHTHVKPPIQDMDTEPEMLSVLKSSSLQAEGPQYEPNEGQHASQKNEQMSQSRSFTAAIL